VSGTCTSASSVRGCPRDASPGRAASGILACDFLHVDTVLLQRIAFDEVFVGNGLRVIKTPVQSSRANSYAERFTGRLRRECLDHVLILGEWHLRQVLAEYARHYNRHRPD
jgi:hypothetical protein